MNRKFKITAFILIYFKSFDLFMHPCVYNCIYNLCSSIVLGADILLNNHNYIGATWHVLHC